MPPKATKYEQFLSNFYGLKRGDWGFPALSHLLFDKGKATRAGRAVTTRCLSPHGLHELKHAVPSLSRVSFLETVRVFFCRREGPYNIGIRGSDEINKERIAALRAMNLMKSGSSIPLLKWLFAAQGN